MADTPMDGARRTARTIYDVGMHRGEDTEFYLRKGFNVVGVEANPDLVRALQARFAAEIGSGRLRIVGKAIWDRIGEVRFAVNRQLSVWGTARDDFVRRNADTFGAPSDYIEVSCTTFEAVLHEYGTPYYLKLDIEGCEMLCIEALKSLPARPRYLSVESRVASPGYGFRDSLTELRMLRDLGYNRFKYVGQVAIPGSERALAAEGEPITHTFPEDSSGPFGGDLRGGWLSFRLAALAALLLRSIDDACGHSGRFYGRSWARVARKLRHLLTGHRDQWYDLHAALPYGSI